jgi:hypothetical protein
VYRDNLHVARVAWAREPITERPIGLETLPLPPEPPNSDTPTRMGFALMLETACEDFEICQRLIRQETTVTSTHQRDRFRAAARIQMALAKSFVFYAVRARRICQHGQGSLRLDRLERTRFLKGTERLVHVRDVNEHGFDANGSSKPSMHLHEEESANVDETAMVILGDKNILMGPLNLYDVYLPAARMKGLAGFSSLPPDLLRGGR